MAFLFEDRSDRFAGISLNQWLALTLGASEGAPDHRGTAVAGAPRRPHPAAEAPAAAPDVLPAQTGVGKWSLTAPAVRRLAGTPVAVVAGALLGDWMLGQAHRYAPVVPMIVIAVVISVASVALKPRGPSLAGQQVVRENLPD